MAWWKHSHPGFIGICSYSRSAKILPQISAEKFRFLPEGIHSFLTNISSTVEKQASTYMPPAVSRNIYLGEVIICFTSFHNNKRLIASFSPFIPHHLILFSLTSLCTGWEATWADVYMAHNAGQCDSELWFLRMALKKLWLLLMTFVEKHCSVAL